MELKSVLHFYLGCECVNTDGDRARFMAFDKLEEIVSLDFGLMGPNYHGFDVSDVKPILRKLDSMTEDEAIQLISILFNDPRLPEEDQAGADEIQIVLAPNDDGLMVDGDMSLVIDVSCRCFEGQIGIRECGSIMLWDEYGKMERLANVPQAFVYMLSKGFDLFGLIESGQAIDASTLTQNS